MMSGLVTRHAVVLRHSPRGTSPNTGNLGLLSPRSVPAVTVPVHPRVIPFPPAVEYADGAVATLSRSGPSVRQHHLVSGGASQPPPTPPHPT
ncbi:hypothetical protein J6590_002961 [Homalodisca vitripennis]|nr:hypothetical protein J6590_002961 [Homalodisca vitripennis]